MDEMRGLGTDKWYRAVTALSVALVVGAAALGGDAGLRRALILLGVAGGLVGIGQWIDHPYQSRILGDFKIHGYPYQPTVVGSVITLVGLVVAGRAVWLLW